MGESSRVRQIVVSVVVALAVGGAGYGAYRYKKAHEVAPVRYKTAKVEKHDIVGKVTASGTLLATVTVQVGTQVSGRVQKLFVDFNSPVKKGQLVAKIDPLLFEAAVEQAKANYLSAKAGVAKSEAQALDADRQHARLKALFANSLAAQQDLESAETNASVAHAQIDVAKASLAQAQASLNQAQVNLSYCNIVSPIDGTVISRNVDVGQTVAASLQAPVLFTIAEDLRKMQVNTNVAEGDVGRLQTGMDVSFTVDAYPGQKFHAKVGQIRNAAQTLQNVVTYDAVIDVDNPDLKLRPGMTANATIVYAESRGVLAVPNAALRFRPPEGSVPSSAPLLTSAAPKVEASAAASAPSPTAPSASASGSAAPATTGPGRHAGGGRRSGGSDGPNESRTLWTLVGGNPAPLPVTTGLTDGSFTEVKGDVAEGTEVIVDTISSTPAAATTTPLPGGGAARRPF